MTSKLCWKCSQEKSISEFGVDRSRADGLNPRCKSCMRIATAASAKRHPETVKKKWDKRYARDRQKIIRQRRKHQIARTIDGNYIIKSEKKCSKCDVVKPINNFRKHCNSADGHYSTCQQCSAEYRKTLDYQAQSKVDRQRRRSRERNAEGSHTSQDIKQIYARQNGKCAHCEKELNFVFHVDHIIPLSKGGSNYPSNLQILCATCNLRKAAKLPSDLIFNSFNNSL